MRVKSERRARLESAVTLILWVSEGVTFVLKLARKDLGLATELGRECNVPMVLANVVEQDILEAIAHGLAEKDMTTAFAIQEDRSGIKARM